LVVGREIQAQIEDSRVVREEASLRGKEDLVLARVRESLATATLADNERVMPVEGREVLVVEAVDLPLLVLTGMYLMQN
jgi:hypothetical protein